MGLPLQDGSRHLLRELARGCFRACTSRDVPSPAGHMKRRLTENTPSDAVLDLLTSGWAGKQAPYLQTLLVAFAVQEYASTGQVRA